MQALISKDTKRLVSLDALRGFTVAGMILVNVPGSWEYIYKPFRHAAFNGLTLADLVFPFFLFIVGASVFLALGRRIESNIRKKEIVKKVIVRSLLIFLLGVFLNWFSSDFKEWRIAGVLQRISLCYLLGSVIFIYLKANWQIIISIAILLLYWVLTIFIGIPGYGRVFTPEMNWAAWIDMNLLPGKMYFGEWDPEGILSTFPALVNTLAGIQAGRLLYSSDGYGKKIRKLSIFGLVLLASGLLISLSFPLNKNVWSSSFVLVTSGLASLLWSLLIYLVDFKNKKGWVLPGIIFGMNALAAYVLHYILIYPFNRIGIKGKSIQEWFMNFFGGVIQPEAASLLWAILYVVVCFIPVYIFYRKKIFIKI